MKTETIKITREVLDLDTFEDVVLVKEPTVQIPETLEEALNSYNGKEDALLSVIADGVKAEQRRIHRSLNENWHTFSDDEQTAVNGPFVGTPADRKVVNGLVLTMAKTVFGYNTATTPEKKREAKNKAIAMIKASDEMKAGLRDSAALKSESED